MIRDRVKYYHALITSIKTNRKKKETLQNNWAIDLWVRMNNLYNYYNYYLNLRIDLKGFEGVLSFNIRIE